jgi:alpha-tubulin suppressor-like RCC1 family protein
LIGNPKRIAAFDEINVDKLRIGLKHSAVVTEEGALYMFGSGNYGVLGLGNENYVIHEKPVLVPSFDKMGLRVVDCHMGDSHSIALTEDGNVWTWGYGGKAGTFNWMYSQDVGALGHGDKTHQFYPKRIEYFT